MNNLQNLQKRLNYHGGQEQQKRMIKDKKRSFEYATQYSYQGATVSFGKHIKVPALMNSNKNSLDYDDKTISIDYQYNLTVGSIFQWDNTQTQWIVYSQDLTELAYFKGDVRRCNHHIKWLNDFKKECSIDVAVIGPKGSRIGGLINSNYVLDLPNYTITILMPNTQETLSYFKRYTKFYLSNFKENNAQICWRVEAMDTVTNPGIIEIFAKEYYINNQEDNVEEGLVGSLIVEETVINNEKIVGDNFIKPGFNYTYTYTGTEQAQWTISNNVPVDIISINNNTIIIQWTELYDGQFELCYGTEKQSIIVEPLF